MVLIDYSSSDESDSENKAPSPPEKKQKKSQGDVNALPPLPSSFLDQYSSTVRTSTQDDPSLHGGRKRATPHVQGHWPTHVYLEWHPSPRPSRLLTDLIATTQHRTPTSSLHTLLTTPLSVPLPLHISLSRSLSLPTALKDRFLTTLKTSLESAGTTSFVVRAEALAWHPNENRTRWFIVLRCRGVPELGELLGVCNGVAGEMGLPTLYQEGKGKGEAPGKFHVSIAWALEAPVEGEGDVRGLDEGLKRRLGELEMAFGEVKVRMGQDVVSIGLKGRRG